MQTEQKLAHTVEIAERLSILILYGIQLGFEWLSFLIRVLFLLGSMLLLNWVYFLERLMLIVLFYWNYNEIVLNSSHFNMLLMKKIVYLYIKFLTYFQYFLVISEKNSKLFRSNHKFIKSLSNLRIWTESARGSHQWDGLEYYLQSGLLLARYFNIQNNKLFLQGLDLSWSLHPYFLKFFANLSNRFWIINWYFKTIL